MSDIYKTIFYEKKTLFNTIISTNGIRTTEKGIKSFISRSLDMTVGSLKRKFTMTKYIVLG